MKYVYSFKEGNKDMRELLGGKGANLAEMTGIGLPVPRGFTVTTEACTKYYDDGKMISEEIVNQIYEKLEELEEKKQSILSSLNEKELELFEMVYTKHMEYAELAKALDISEHAVRSRVYRLRVKIKERASFMFMALLLLIMKL